MRTWKRVLAFVLALVMVLSLASMPTFAETKSTYDIVINYKFEDDTIVSDPYTASLAAGTSFSATVTFPTVQGYLPYVDEEQKDSIDLNYTSMDRDVTIDVVYKPTNVNYTVIHYQQNVDNDEYTVVETETQQGLTGSQVPEVAKTYVGFYALLYERPAIAADGSTVIEIYYDRYYYLMNFDMDGGYGTEPVYARYGATVGTVKNPTKAGYTFEGWEPADIPGTMPADHKAYKAKWTPVDTAKVTIVFWGENADDEQYSYLSDYTKELNLTPGTEFTYSETGMLTCGKGTHTHNDECYEFTCTVEAHEHNNDCYTCGNAEHKHAVGCYPGASSEIPDDTSAPWNAPSNPKNGQVLTETHIFVTRKYIYIDGNWYTYTGNEASGSVVSPNCGMTEHTHSDDCIGCGKTEHTHTRANCYKLNCTKTEHTHTSACYEQGAGLDSTLWKFVKSDTITVEADGSTVVNVYYDRVEYSVQFYENQNCSSNREYTSLKITAKWGQNILAKWPTYNGSSSWYVKDKSNTWQNSIQVMPVGGAKFWGPKSGNSKYTATYYVEILDGESYDVKGSDGRYYKVHHTDTSNSSGNVTDEERYGIDGFTINNSISTSNGSSYGGSKFYYTRNSYKLTFNDQYNDVKNETVKFEAPLSTYKDYVPEVPSAFEPGSVEFGGWYQNPQCTGEEYKLDEHTMPSHDIILYAKWVPVNRTVTFYLTEKSTEVYAPADTEFEKAQFTVPHGGNIAKEYVEHHLTRDAMLAAKPNGDYTFVMWYYYENGVKTPFDPTMQIRKDLTLYGEWSSNTLKQYTVQFVLKDDHSVKVADDITGSGLAGTTKTFDAKGGTDLYAAYQEGYFPTVQSQSLLLDIESDSLVITFEYVPMPAVPYTVKYINTETGTSEFDGETVADKVVSDNRKAVVTETFKPISGYMPDAYQKRLIVTVDGENILYFYYTKDTEHALYKITHYTQSTDGTTWSEYASSQATGNIGTRYTASPMTISGFTYSEIKYVVNGTEVTDVTNQGAKLTENGLEINLYYVRNEYPYQVRYLEVQTGNVLHDPKNGTGKFGQIISESAIDIDGYEKVDPTSATLNIRIDEGEGAPNINIITFYYNPVFYVHHVQSGTLKTELDDKLNVLDYRNGIDLTSKVSKNFLYGGTFDTEACNNENIDYTKLFNNTDGNPKQTQPQAGDHFYIWEVSDTYLSARNFYVSRHLENENPGQLTVCRYYLLTNVDRLLYQDLGFTIDGEDVSSGGNGHSEFKDVEGTLKDSSIPVYGKVNIIKGGKYADTLYLTDTGAITMDNKVGENYTPETSYGYMGAYRLTPTQFASFLKDGTTFTPYWVTLDGVKVTGTTTRTGSYDESNPGVPKVVKNVETGSVCTYVGGSTQEEPALMSLRYVPEYLLDDSTPDSVTITINDNGEISQLETLPGDVRGQLSCAAPEGKLFAGWYSDEACTTAAQLTDVQEDITVYAKYVSDDYLTLKYNRNGLFRVTGVSLVSAIDSDSYAETGFLINGETYVVDSYATRYRLFYTAGSLFGGDVARKAPLMTLDYALSGSGTLEVIPYWVTLDGTTVTGEARTLTYTSRTIRG